MPDEAFKPYAKLNEKSQVVIGVEIDSLTALRNNSLIPKILKVPASIENPRLSIDKVDFIILNK